MMPTDMRSFADIKASVADAIGRVRPTQLMADMIALVAYVQGAERERDEARRVALIDAIMALNDAGDDDTRGDEWLAGFAAAITVLRQLVESPARGEEG